jgi:hypothetical protein
LLIGDPQLVLDRVEDPLLAGRQTHGPLPGCLVILVGGGNREPATVMGSPCGQGLLVAST